MGTDTEIKRSALVVDDNDANTLVLSTLLKRLGFDVDTASSGLEAIDHTCQRRYDVIFMDHLMPGMDGIETIQQILFLTKGGKKPVAVGVSATIEQEMVDAFLKAGAQDVLEKPVMMEKLEEKLHSLGLITKGSRSEEEDGGDQSLDSILSKVQGLNYRKGLEMMAGSVENYMRILNVSIKNIMDNYTAIDVIRETSQMGTFALHFHSLKGIFLNIGADDMAEKSKELELAAKAGSMDIITAKLEQYLEEVLSFHMELKGAYGQYAATNQKDAPGREVSESEFMQDLEELRQHIEDFEYIEITETLEKLLSGSQGEKRAALEAVSNAIQEFDYDLALNLVDELR